jgi:hypothetical protein
MGVVGLTTGSGTNLTVFFGRKGGGGGGAFRDGRSLNGWGFRRSLGLMSPVHFLGEPRRCLIGD